MILSSDGLIVKELLILGELLINGRAIARR